MPPSPSPRRSPGWKPGPESHKRGRSLESGLSFREKDDDLALFNEMQNKEQDNFLLQSNDDFDNLLSTRLKPFPDFKLGINIPARGESSDILNMDGDKNDYDWLLTPPDTPLFPKLDDDPLPLNIVHNGRPRGRPISISRSLTMEKNYRSSRGSASPQRSSRSPRSGTGVFQSRERPSSAPRSSPSPIIRPSTPTRRPSPPPIKPSTPPARSSTPTPRRLSTGSGAMHSPGTRGISPVRSTRGSSSSPKVRAWQSNIPGFSLEAPPNLRTSLADRPASYVRGSSPASRNSRDSSSRVGRQSMSPTASRSISSSYSHERDRFSSNSKGSVASSGDDDADSLLSVPISVPDHGISRKGANGTSNNGPVSFSKKPTRTFSPSSAPKRSFDTAIRQMERKSPQKMFRPLLSSVPSSTFYSGKLSTSHRTMISRNSSVTTSSNASSDQATSGAPETEGSEHNQDDATSECEKLPFADVQEEIFAFDKMDDAGDDNEIHETSPLPHIQPAEEGSVSVFDSTNTEEHSLHNAIIPSSTSLETVHVPGESMEIQCPKGDVLCLQCGCSLDGINELVEGDNNLCSDCRQKQRSLVFPVLSSEVDASQYSFDEVETTDAYQPCLTVPEALQVLETEVFMSDVPTSSFHENINDSHPCCEGSEKSCPIGDSEVVLEENASADASINLKSSEQSSIIPDHSMREAQELSTCFDEPSPKIEMGEVAGISVLFLNRSGSSKGPLLHQSRSFTATAVSYDDKSYAKESTASLRSSIGYGSASSSSSLDMPRHGEIIWQRQLSGKKIENGFRPQSTGSSFSGTSSQTSQGLGLDLHRGMRHIVMDEVQQANLEPASAFENNKLLDREASFSRSTVLKEDPSQIDSNLRGSDTHISDVSNDLMSTTQFEDSSLPSLAVHDGHVTVSDVHSPKKVESGTDLDDKAASPSSSLMDEGAMQDNGVEEVAAVEAPDAQNQLASVSEIELEDCHPHSPGSQNDAVAKESSQEPSPLPQSEKNSSDSPLQTNDSDAVHNVIEESSVMVEDQRGRRTRSLTLEEATDTILFCSSIVHDLAYQAANIAIEKEKENLVPLEGSRPMVTIVGTDRSRPPHGGRSLTKRTLRSQKGRRKQAEMGKSNPLSNKSENDAGDRSAEPVAQNEGLPSKVDNMKPPKLESKCNCTIM